MTRNFQSPSKSAAFVKLGVSVAVGGFALLFAALVQAQVEPTLPAEQQYQWLRLDQAQARFRREHAPATAREQRQLQRDLAAQRRALGQLQMQQQREQMLRRQQNAMPPAFVYPPQSQIDAMNYQRQQQQLQLQLQMQRRAWPYPRR